MGSEIGVGERKGVSSTLSSEKDEVTREGELEGMVWSFFC